MTTARWWHKQSRKSEFATVAAYCLGRAHQIEENWKRCPSTHCERREECGAPNGCIVGERERDRAKAKA